MGPNRGLMPAPSLYIALFFPALFSTVGILAPETYEASHNKLGILLWWPSQEPE